MYVQDPDGRIVHANRAACELVGRPPEEVVGKLPSELFDPVTAERWDEQNREVLRTGRPLDVEDGWGGRTHLTHKTPVFDADGKPVAVVGISTDITDRKRAEDALRRSESNLAEAQQIAGVGSWHWDVRDRRAGVVDRALPPLRHPARGAADGRRGAAARPRGRPRARPRRDRRRARGRGADGPRHPDPAPRRRASRILHCRARRHDGPRRVVAPARRHLRRRHGPAPRRAPPGRGAAARAARLVGLGRRRATRSRGRARCTGSSARTPSDFVPTSDAAHRTHRRGGPRPAHRADPGGARARRRLRRVRPHPAPRRGDPRRPLPRLDGHRRRAPRAGHLHGICQDLTDVRRAEEARAEAVERFRSVFERAPIGMALLARDGRFTLANEAMAEFLGRPGGALLDCTRRGRHPSRRHARDARGAARGWWRASCRSGTPRSATCGRAARSAGARCGRCSCTTPTAGRSTALALLRDVTEQRLAERRRSALHGVVADHGRRRAAERGAAGARRDGRARARLAARERCGCSTREGALRCEAAWPTGSAPPRARRSCPPSRRRPATGIVIPIVSGAEALGLLELACDGPERLGDDLTGFAGGARCPDRRVPRPQARRGAAAPPGAARPAHRAAQPACCSSTASTTRSGGCSASTPRWPCSSSTSTASRRSTTASGTPAATRCSSAPPTASPPRCGRRTPSRASAATSSSCSPSTSQGRRAAR